MAFINLSPIPRCASFAATSIPIPIPIPLLQRNQLVVKITNCNSNESSSSKLEIGSPIIITAAPQLLKTAASVPCLRVNAGVVKPGDVGRIVSRKPKDVWAVRLSIGTYLIDAKYFKPLELDNHD